MSLQVKMILTEEEMDELLGIAELAGEVALVETLWDILLGQPLSTWEGQIDARSYAIPQHQWSMLCKACIDSPVGMDGMRGGTMMNWGPSSWVEAENGKWTSED